MALDTARDDLDVFRDQVVHDAGHQAVLAAAGIRGSVGPRQTTFAPMPTVPGSDLYPVKMHRDVLPGKRGDGRDPTRMKSVRRFYPVKVKAEFYPVKGR